MAFRVDRRHANVADCPEKATKGTSNALRNTNKPSGLKSLDARDMAEAQGQPVGPQDSELGDASESLKTSQQVGATCHSPEVRSFQCVRFASAV